MVKRIFSKDLYVSNQKLFDKYRNFQTKQEEIIDFDHASLARPFKEVFEKINKSKKLKKELYKLENKARERLCSLVGIKDIHKIIFGRNTTEALSFVFWLADVEKGNVILPDSENESIIRIFKEHRDHGNTNRKDRWSTFPDKIISEKFRGFNNRKKTGIKIKIAKFLKNFEINKILKLIDEKTKLILVSHVVRNNGKIIDIIKLAKQIKKKNPKTFIAIDGAQALGNLKCADFNELEKNGIDFYAATPHKTLGSYPLGILFISERMKGNMSNLKNKSPLEQIIMSGMISKKFKIKPNMNIRINPLRFLSIITAIDTIRKKGFNKGKFFSEKIKFLLKLKKEFVQKIKDHNFDLIKISPQSPAIISFRISHKNNRKIVASLEKKGIFCSYLSETDNIRVSLDITNKPEEIEKFFSALCSLLH